jgi:hypothetical protein
MSENQQRSGTDEEPSEPPKPTSYSPQDARSDLPSKQEGVPQQKTTEIVAPVGSPETRKSKKKNRSPKKKGEAVLEKTSGEREIPQLDLAEQQKEKEKMQTPPVEVVKDTRKDAQPATKPAVKEAPVPVEVNEVVQAQKETATITTSPRPVEAKITEQIEAPQTVSSPTTKKASLDENIDTAEIITIAPDALTEAPVAAVEQTSQTPPSDAQSPLKADKVEEKRVSESIDAEDDPAVDKETQSAKVEDEVHDEAVPDEEPSSFLSAKESQSENEKQEPKAEDVPSKETVAAADPEPVSSTAPTVEQAKEAKPVSLETAVEVKDVNVADSAAPAAEGSAKETAASSPAAPPGPTLKKGPSRVESLSVFSKAKAEAKKEKAAKKKEKKKAKAQKGTLATKAMSAYNALTNSSSGTASQTTSLPTSRKPSVAGSSSEPVAHNKAKTGTEKIGQVHTSTDSPSKTLNSESTSNTEKCGPLGVKTQEATPGASSSDDNTQTALSSADARQEKALPVKAKKDIKVAVPKIPFATRSSSGKSSGGSSPTVIMKTPDDDDTSPRGMHPLTPPYAVIPNALFPDPYAQADKSPSEVSPIAKGMLPDTFPLPFVTLHREEQDTSCRSRHRLCLIL